MALADILKRIEDDADAEAYCVLDEARKQADWQVEKAKTEAEERHEHVLAEARRTAERERETMLANARLRARDRAVAARRELVGRVLRKAEETLTDLPDDTYVALIAQRLVAAARGGETVLIAAGESERLAPKLPGAVEEAARDAGRTVELEFGREPAEIPHGVVLTGDRMSVEISPAALLRERSEELQALAAGVLFPEAEEPGAEEPLAEQVEESG